MMSAASIDPQVSSEEKRSVFSIPAAKLDLRCLHPTLRRCHHGQLVRKIAK